jgi:hypothetical protein
VAAFGLWLYVITVVSPDSEASFDVTVEVDNEKALHEKGMMLNPDQKLTVHLKLSGNRSDLINLTDENITVKVDASKILEIADPLRDETRRYLKIKWKSEEILHLSREDGQSDTTCETYDYRIWYELEDRSHLAETHSYEEHTCHDCSDDEALHSILAHNTGNDYDKRSSRTSDKEV